MSRSFGTQGTVQTFSEDSTSGNPVPTVSTSGMLHVNQGIVGAVHIRESQTLGTSAETFDFSTTPIRAATIYLMPIATVTNENISGAVCIDPPNATVRDTWLTVADSLTSDSQRIPVSIYQPLELIFTSAIDYIGGKIDIGTDQECRMIVVGVE